MRSVRIAAQGDSSDRASPRFERRSRLVGAAFGVALAAAAAGGCTFLVQFQDDGADAGEDASSELDGTTGGAVDGDRPDAPQVVDAAIACPADANGLAWSPPDDTARCCGGEAVYTTTDQNCGACGIRCNVDAGQTCAKVIDHYYCVGCEGDAAALANGSCWSGCCSVSFYKQGLCAASVCATGACNGAVCPAGTKCKTPPQSSNYCGYD